jgi:hypothetical protein
MCASFGNMCVCIVCTVFFIVYVYVYVLNCFVLLPSSDNPTAVNNNSNDKCPLPQ